MLPEEWFASLYINSTETYNDFIWWEEPIKKKARVNHKKIMRDKRRYKKEQKRLERQYKKEKLQKYCF